MTPAPSAPAGSWIDAIGPGWLTDVLRAARVATAAVRHVETRPLAVASAAGDLARLSLTFEPGRPPGPATIIAKAPGSGPAQRAMDAAMGLFSRERFVYAELAGALPVRLPRCYYAGDQDNQKPMLLEDLGALRPGDQVSGLDRADAERLIDVATTWTSAGSTTARACSTPWPPESRCSGGCGFVAATPAGSPIRSCCAP